MQVGRSKSSHRNCAQIVPAVSVLPILSVLSLDRISNLRVFNGSNEFNSHSRLQQIPNTILRWIPDKS
jgi:hypothetical protein